VGLLAALLVVGGCGGDQTPGERALDKAQGHLEDVHSGTLDMTFLASKAAAPADRGLGFALEGTFAVASK
jgi:hypothetical protein